MDFPISLAARVRELARTRGDAPAYLVEDRVLDWAGYDEFVGDLHVSVPLGWSATVVAGIHRNAAGSFENAFLQPGAQK